MQNLEIKYVDFTALKGFELDGQRLFELAEQAKYYVASDADSCAVKLRNFAECFVNGIYERYRIDERNFDLCAKIRNAHFARKLSTITQANSTNDTRTQTQENSANSANSTQTNSVNFASNASPTNAANSRAQERERETRLRKIHGQLAKIGKIHARLATKPHKALQEKSSTFCTP